MSSEREIPQEKLPQKEPRYDVRVFPYGVRSLPDLLKDIHSLKPNETLSLFEVYMGQKTNLIDKTKQPIMPLGGQINDDEIKNKEKAGLTRLSEQSTLTVVPYNEPSMDLFAFEYKKKPDEPNTRVYFKSAFVINPDTLPAVCLQLTNDTDTEMIPMNLTDFRKSIKTGEYKDKKLAGVTNYSEENSEIIINDADKDRRETFLKMLFLSIEERETKFRETLKNRLIIDASRSGISSGNNDDSLESILKTIKEDGNLDEILKASLDRIIREDYMNYFRTYEKSNFQILKI